MNDNDYCQFWLKSPYILKPSYSAGGILTRVRVGRGNRKKPNFNLRRFVARVVDVDNKNLRGDLMDIQSIWRLELYNSEITFQLPIHLILANRGSPDEKYPPNGERELICPIERLGDYEMKQIEEYQGLFSSMRDFTVKRKRSKEPHRIVEL